MTASSRPRPARRARSRPSIVATRARSSRRTSDPELAADLGAEVFAAVLASSARYRPRKAPAHAWLFGIAEHKLASSRRRGRVEDRARRRLRMAPIELEDERQARCWQLRV